MLSKPIVSLAIVGVLVGGCSNTQGPPSEPPAPKPQAASQGQRNTQGLETKRDVPAATGAMPKLEKPKDPKEACGQVIVVAWKGAAHAGPQIAVDKPQAQQRAVQLLTRAIGGADFAALARQSSDASASKLRGGIIGTYKIDEWPQLHLPIRDTVFGLMVNQVTDELVETPYGYAIVRRCPVERAHARHILVRFQGAKRAEATVTRGKVEAKQLAEKIRAEVNAPGADFAAIAQKRSEDSSATKGGDIGNPARGMLAPPFEEALFALKPGETSGVVETEFGFHIIQRLPGP
jgi:hypothetical protein